MPGRALRRIFFVEDDPDIRTVTRMALEAVGGFTVATCGSGQEALSEVQAFAPDLILLDVMMPVMDGPATLAALRRIPAAAEVPVVFMTARVQSQEILLYKELGACDVIAKPFDPMLLADIVRAIWASLDR